jgi:hypothetical protein
MNRIKYGGEGKMNVEYDGKLHSAGRTLKEKSNSREKKRYRIWRFFKFSTQPIMGEMKHMEK